MKSRVACEGVYWTLLRRSEGEEEELTAFPLRRLRRCDCNAERLKIQPEERGRELVVRARKQEENIFIFSGEDN